MWWVRSNSPGQRRPPRSKAMFCLRPLTSAPQVCVEHLMPSPVSGVGAVSGGCPLRPVSAIAWQSRITWGLCHTGAVGDGPACVLPFFIFSDSLVDRLPQILDELHRLARGSILESYIEVVSRRRDGTEPSSELLGLLDGEPMARSSSRPGTRTATTQRLPGMLHFAAQLHPRG